MAIANANAEASSSQTNNNAPNSSQNALSRMASPPNTAVSSLRSPPPTGRTTASSRKVRTVPPSAAYEPDTPDSSHPNSLPSATAPTTAATNGTFPSTSSRRHRKLYSRHSSGSSGGDSDDESDGEAPFWAFTTHGKAKIRSRMIKGQGGTSTPPQSSKSTHLNVFSGLADVGRFSRRGSRQNSTDKETFKRQPSPDAGRRRSLGDLAAPRMILDPPIRQSSTNSSPPRRKKRVEINAPAMSRSTSEPSSPVNKTINLPSSEPQLQPPPPIALSGNQSDPTISQQSQARKKLTPIQTRFLRRPELGEAITDSETGDELRRPKPRGFRASTLNISGSADDTDGATSRRAAIKKQASKLKANLAPQVSQHFNGWPQAGSWQDVYYGIHDEPEPMSDPGVLRPGRSNKPSSKPSSLKNIRRDRFATPDNTDHEMEVPSEAAMRKKNRQRRYRHALSPPTPSGLGFEPKDNGEGAVAKWKEGRIGPQQNGFDWSQGRREGTIDEGQEDLSRAPTNITGLEAMNEKTGAGEGVTQVPRRWYTSRAKRRLEAERGQRFEHIPIKKKLRRMLFLDARVTIWIRALNLAVVIASLALAVSIRLKLDELLLPGLIGSSTTLIIAYSSLTAFHVLTAIYREYFGRPIGLWGLRQKMLWVCLDLIFIGLWSSALSIATNDYIATPLDCTPDTPWWRGNLADHYAMLVARLAANDPNSTSTLATHAITPVEMIAQSLGISLPVEVLQSPVTREICEKQEGSIALALLTLLLYTINMVLSLFRIFETVRRTMGANDKILV